MRTRRERVRDELWLIGWCVWAGIVTTAASFALADLVGAWAWLFVGLAFPAAGWYADRVVRVVRNDVANPRQSWRVIRSRRF